jgi:hypothetical protein
MNSGAIPWREWQQVPLKQWYHLPNYTVIYKKIAISIQMELGKLKYTSNMIGMRKCCILCCHPPHHSGLTVLSAYWREMITSLILPTSIVGSIQTSAKFCFPLFPPSTYRIQSDSEYHLWFSRWWMFIIFILWHNVPLRGFVHHTE